MRSTRCRQELGLGLGWVGVGCTSLHGPTPEEGPPGHPYRTCWGWVPGPQRCRAGPVQVVLT